jgi:anti-sigma regulatory factor (Ser/Thr protein kinase)
MNLELKTFHFTGLQNYERYAEEIDHILNACFQCENDFFFIALTEAVNNAARYSVYGMSKARITISIRIMQNDIAVTVQSKTRPFNAFAYQQKLIALLNDPETCDLDWGDYTIKQLGGRGFWFILQAVDYLYVDANGQEVTLCAKTPMADKNPSGKVGDLVPKFLVKQNGVIR